MKKTNSTQTTMVELNYLQVQTPQTFDHRKSYRKEFKNPSVTRPDMALSIREILTKHSSVKQLPQMKEPIYDQGLSELGISNKSLDLTDLAYLREKNQQKLDELKETLERQQQLKNQIEYDDRVQKEVQKRLETELKKGKQEEPKP